MRNKDKFRGCLIGGAIGDALGFSVEFLNIDQIMEKYGNSGITEYNLKDNIAIISDDTQMTLFTANGLLIRTTRGMMRGIAANPSDYCGRCYRAWLQTQNEDYDSWKQGVKDINHEYPWLIRVPELHHRRAPGNTVLSALSSKELGTLQIPINNSKGCGGLMRIAPVGIYYEHENIDRICLYGAEIAALTHGHALGYIPAAALVYILNNIMYKEYNNLEEIIIKCIQKMNKLFDSEYLKEFNNIMKKSIELSKEKMDDIDAISILGKGWVAEETLAISIYCSLKYKNDFTKAIVASVNHSGDSDSTGSVTGNIMGTLIGYNNIPTIYLNNLELKDIIMEIADDLFNDCTIHERDILDVNGKKWFNKYAC
jgi:ADP-ribosylglycohydrolase